jgi:glucan phosphoethanolaminetransferase (alkaline phosphatase superfamily)
LKEDKSFIYKKAYASGVDTLTAVPTFFLMKREPENISLLGKTYTNLMTLAKQHGYKVSYITTQKLNIMAPYSGDADYIKKLEGKDEVLVKALNNIDFSKKNFIVLHQRNSHSPYENFTPEKFYEYPFKNKDFQTYMLNSYANSILYTDYVMKLLIKKIKTIPNSVVFITSDHAELMGLKEEDGRYGHSYLSREGAKVPVMIYMNGLDKKLEKQYRKVKCFNHYNLGKMVANAVGYSVVNTNENDKYYIQGTSIDGTNGFIEYSEEECKNLNKQSDD